VGGIFDAERLRGLEVDDQLELGRLLHRRVDRLSLPFQVSTLHGDVAWRCALVSTTDRWLADLMTRTNQRRVKPEGVLTNPGV
jgi:hypothetical protein